MQSPKGLNSKSLPLFDELQKVAHFVSGTLMPVSVKVDENKDLLKISWMILLKREKLAWKTSF